MLTDAVATVAAFSTAGQLGLLDRMDREPAMPDGHDAALHELSLYPCTHDGSVHRPESYRNWMRDAGLSSVDTVALPSEPAITVITARSAGCRR